MRNETQPTHSQETDYLAIAQFHLAQAQIALKQLEVQSHLPQASVSAAVELPSPESTLPSDDYDTTEKVETYLRGRGKNKVEYISLIPDSILIQFHAAKKEPRYTISSKFDDPDATIISAEGGYVKPMNQKGEYLVRYIVANSPERLQHMQTSFPDGWPEELRLHNQSSNTLYVSIDRQGEILTPQSTRDFQKMCKDGRKRVEVTLRESNGKKEITAIKTFANASEEEAGFYILT